MKIHPFLPGCATLWQGNRRIWMHTTEGGWSQCSSSAPGMDAAHASLTCLSFSQGTRAASTKVNWHTQCRETCYKYSIQPYGDPCSEVMSDERKAVLQSTLIV